MFSNKVNTEEIVELHLENRIHSRKWKFTGKGHLYKITLVNLQVRWLMKNTILNQNCTYLPKENKTFYDKHDTI